MKRSFLILLFLFAACNPLCLRDTYRTQYVHLDTLRRLRAEEKPIQANDYYLLVLVDAKHLDYSSPEALLATIAKHPDGSRHKDFGHAWIYLRGIKGGEIYTFEGGHSGEVDLSSPRYLDSILEHQEDPNPIRFLFLPRSDGYLEEGSGGHTPTFALYVPLKETQFMKLLSFIDKENYHFQRYSITESQCATFVAKAASIAGLDLDGEMSFSVPESCTLYGRKITLWHDPRYRTMELATPDQLERSMMKLALEGKAMVALRF